MADYHANMLSMPTTVRAVAELLGASIEGDPNVRVRALSSLDTAGPQELTFSDEKHEHLLADARAGAAIVGAKAARPASGLTLIRVPNVAQAMIQLLGSLARPTDLPTAGVHPSAVVAPDAKLGDGVAIGPCVVINSKATIGDRAVLCAGAFVGARVAIGAESLIGEGVVVKADCVIGNRVQVGPNCVIGGEGFGYYTADGVHHKIPHVGNVVIEDDVELGACVCVDRAKFDSTRIGAGSKIDNLVQIAHNVQIGRGCRLSGLTGVAGSAHLGDYVVTGGHAGIRDNITLGNGVICSAFAAVASDVPDGQVVAGVPAGPAREQFRLIAAMSKLPDLLKRVRELESRLESLESPKDH